MDAHVAFSGKVIHPREMVDPLKGFHLVEHIHGDLSIRPVHIPRHFRISCKFPFVNFLSNLFYNLISGFFLNV
jgi:hypothetical protein